VSISTFTPLDHLQGLRFLYRARV